MRISWNRWGGTCAAAGLAALVLSVVPTHLLAQGRDPAEAPTGSIERPAPLIPWFRTIPMPSVASVAQSQSALDAIEASITISQDRAEELKLEIEEMRGDRARQNAALIAAAQRVKLAEADIAELETRLDTLIVEEMTVRGRLDGADASIANVLAALERISRNPPPALMVNPSDALGSARGAILISAIFPQLRDTADQVTADLERLTSIKAAALEEERLLKANFQILEEEQLRIATLSVARKQGEQIVSAALLAEEKATEELAARASSLKELIASLSARANAVASDQPQAPAAVTTAALDPDSIDSAIADTSRMEPAIPFDAARGRLVLPATGSSVTDYGASDGFGGIARGISIATREDAQVVAPADGWVLYQGNYLNYGQIIILNAGQDYTILLAGLEKVTVDVGQFVLMGEPVGAMGSRTIGQAETTSAGVARPTLYIEMRKNNEPIDPTGWWAAANPTQSG